MKLLTGSMLSDGYVKLLVNVVRGYNVPTRQTRDSNKFGESNYGFVNDDGRSENTSECMLIVLQLEHSPSNTTFISLNEVLSVFSKKKTKKYKAYTMLVFISCKKIYI